MLLSVDITAATDFPTKEDLEALVRICAAVFLYTAIDRLQLR
jgi:hypothetical protein